ATGARPRLWSDEEIGRAAGVSWQSAKDRQLCLPEQREVMMVRDQHAHISGKVEGLRQIIRSPILGIVPGVRAGEVNGPPAAVGEVVGIVCGGAQRNRDRF